MDFLYCGSLVQETSFIIPLHNSLFLLDQARLREYSSATMLCNDKMPARLGGYLRCVYGNNAIEYMLMSGQYVTSCCLTVLPEETLGTNLASHFPASLCSRVPATSLSPSVSAAVAVITLCVSPCEASFRPCCNEFSVT